MEPAYIPGARNKCSTPSPPHIKFCKNHISILGMERRSIFLCLKHKTRVRAPGFCSVDATDSLSVFQHFVNVYKALENAWMEGSGEKQNVIITVLLGPK